MAIPGRVRSESAGDFAGPAGRRAGCARMSRVLVTGAGSFTARHLLPLLARQPDVTMNLTDRSNAAGPGIVPLDLTDRAAVLETVRDVRPDVVYHFAGVPATDAERCYAVNFDGTRHLLDACAATGGKVRVLLVSSAAVYGLTRPEESPVRENAPLRPVSAYGVSKAAAELAALALHRRGLLRVRIVRPFNLIGPGLPPGFAPSDFMAGALALRASGGTREIAVGALEPRRDFVDVRDAVRAYLDLANLQGEWGDIFNVASGRPVRIGDLFEAVMQACGVNARAVEDPDRRRVEVVEQVGDASALRAATGWRPGIGLEESVRDMVAGCA